MTNQEAIVKAQAELNTVSYLAEAGSNAGLRAMNQKKALWLVKVLFLARKHVQAAEAQINSRPLSLDNLLAMDGEPVWVKHACGLTSSAWYIVDAKNMELKNPRDKLTLVDWDDGSYRAYCNKPKEGCS